MSWSVNFEVEEASCWLIFVNTIGSKQRYRWISGPWFVRCDFPNSKTSLKPWFFLSEFELKWAESCMRWTKSNQCNTFPFLCPKTKETREIPKELKQMYGLLMSFAYWKQQARLETKSGQLGSQGKPTQTTRLEKEGKHFFWTSLHVFWTWALLLDLTTILLEMATLLLDLHTLLLDLILPSLLLDLALSQTIPFSNRFYNFCPAASASQFFRQ